MKKNMDLISELANIEIEELANEEFFQNTYELKVNSIGAKFTEAVLIKKKRKLSALQKAYRDFFLSMLSEYNVVSPAKLNKELKKEFFIRIKVEWKVKKAKLQEVKAIKPIVSKKEQYASVPVSRPSIAIEPFVTSNIEVKTIKK